MKTQYLQGVKHGIPIALGYFSVSFGFGIMAVRAGISPLAAVIISVTNLTSAGQAAGVSVIAEGGTLMEMALTQLVINLRYALMAISLSQKVNDKFTLPHRLLAGYGITDEIFAVAVAQPKSVSPAYMYGLITAGFGGWSIGTFLGAFAGSALPSFFTDAMGIMLYGMFLAIIIPAAKKQRSVLFVILAAAGLSALFKYVFDFVGGGFAIIISTAAASALAALLFPVKEGAEQ
ncbi:MAG: AzlC family ABC transporter permease [Firmicutes bacterium]|nr:AzlC family ABC transporter permease [[Eubacterium] siraeum]MCM1489137.1 AzlC family ABC transporter permease [Bacillota bacterium]